jgi:hypothetical protein
MIDINIDQNPFGELAERSPGGGFLQGTSGDVLPEITALLANEGLGKTGKVDWASH